MKKETGRKSKASKQSWYGIVIICCLFLVALLLGQYFYMNNRSDEIPIAEDKPEVVEEIHQPTGFIIDEGMQETITNCTSCHSAKLVTQNRMSKEGWINTIRWMQETQNLWNLGPNEEIITNYLAKHYAPTETGRRKALSGIEWYRLE